MAVPYTFATATSAIPLSNLDSNFATAITLGNTAVYLGNTTTSLGNVTLTNATISSVASTFPNSFLANSTATLGNATITLGGTTTNVGNLTLANVTITSVGTTFPNSYLSNSAVTIGNTSVSLGSTVTSFGNVTLTNATISSVSTPLTVAQGGTGLVTITANGLMTGNGTGNVTIISAGTTGNVLTSNGTAWLSTAPSAFSYPGAGIVYSTGSAWGTSYTTTGTGTVVALATSPSFTTPVLGTPTSGNLSTCTADGTNAVGYRNIPQVGSAKTASYTLVVGDVGKFVVLGTSGLVVIPASIFAVGDAISVVNNTTASITCTSSAITAYLGGTNTVVTSFSLATRGVCTILFVTTSVVVITGNVS